MKLSITGSRSLTYIPKLHQIVCSLSPMGFYSGAVTEIVSGGAVGVDTVAKEYAATAGIPFKLFPANWKRWGKTAGLIRNEEMAEYVDGGIVFWDGESTGTQHMISMLKKHDKKFVVFQFKLALTQKGGWG